LSYKYESIKKLHTIYYRSPARQQKANTECRSCFKKSGQTGVTDHTTGQVAINCI